MLGFTLHNSLVRKVVADYH